MIKLGMKLFSTNCLQTPDLAEKVINYINEHDDMFFELMAIPESFEETHRFFRDRLDRSRKVVIHNAHEAFNFNTGDSSCREANRKMLDESRRFADVMGAEIIIVHAGNGFGEEGHKETVYQFSTFKDERVAVENLPMICDTNNQIMQGLTPQAIKEIKDASGCKFCFDFAHAICAANGLGISHDEMMQGFADLQPDMYHFCDGDVTSGEDVHWHFGEGTYDLKKYLNRYVSADALVTMETGAKPNGIEKWVADRAYLHKLIAE